MQLKALLRQNPTTEQLRTWLRHFKIAKDAHRNRQVKAGERPTPFDFDAWLAEVV